MDNKEVELDNGLTEKGLIDFAKTVLLSGDSPRGEEALNNLKWGIKQYRKHLILPVVGVTLPLKEYNERVDEYLNNQRNHPIERTPERMRTIEAVAYHCKRIAEELAK